MGKFPVSNYSPDHSYFVQSHAVEELESSEKSQIVCLQDVSESMQTKDVMMEDNEPIKRSSWTQQFLGKTGLKI